MFEVPFQVPYNGAVETILIKSTTPYRELRYILANKMRVDTDDLQIGYKFSTDARAKAANHLGSDVHLQELMDEATPILQSYSTGKRRAKSFKVEFAWKTNQEAHLLGAHTTRGQG